MLHSEICMFGAIENGKNFCLQKYNLLKPSPFIKKIKIVPLVVHGVNFGTMKSNWSIGSMDIIIAFACSHLKNHDGGNFKHVSHR